MFNSHAKSKSTSAKQLRERDKDVVEKENQKLATMPEWGQGMPSVKRASQVERDRKVWKISTQINLMYLLKTPERFKHLFQCILQTYFKR